MPTAKGPFEVRMTPLPGDTTVEGVGLGGRSLDKVYQGDLEATGVGQMLSVLSPANSGVYVALERVTGKLAGREGSFVLAHRGVMTATSRDLTIIVAPGSATGELAGLEGSMSIEIVDGKHGYSFDYRFG
jgi:hypothetical protein